MKKFALSLLPFILRFVCGLMYTKCAKLFEKYCFNMGCLYLLAFYSFIRPKFFDCWSTYTTFCISIEMCFYADWFIDPLLAPFKLGLFSFSTICSQQTPYCKLLLLSAKRKKIWIHLKWPKLVYTYVYAIVLGCLKKSDLFVHRQIFVRKC